METTSNNKREDMRKRLIIFVLSAMELVADIFFFCVLKLTNNPRSVLEYLVMKVMHGMERGF